MLNGKKGYYAVYNPGSALKRKKATASAVIIDMQWTRGGYHPKERGIIIDRIIKIKNTEQEEINKESWAVMLDGLCGYPTEEK